MVPPTHITVNFAVRLLAHWLPVAGTLTDAKAGITKRGVQCLKCCDRDGAVQSKKTDEGRIGCLTICNKLHGAETYNADASGRGTRLHGTSVVESGL